MDFNFLLTHRFADPPTESGGGDIQTVLTLTDGDVYLAVNLTISSLSASTLTDEFVALPELDALVTTLLIDDGPTSFGRVVRMETYPDISGALYGVVFDIEANYGSSSAFNEADLLRAHLNNIFTTQAGDLPVTGTPVVGSDFVTAVTIVQVSDTITFVIPPNDPVDLTVGDLYIE